MMAEKPVWLLDIDGVINAVGDLRLRETTWPDARWVVGRADAGGGATFTITAAEPTLQFIRRVHEEDLAEIRWLTTWRDAAQNVADLLCLPTFPVQREHVTGHTWWKERCAEHVVNVEQRQLIWTDDDLHTELSAACRYRLKSAGALLIRPNYRVGLVAGELARIEAFCRATADTGKVATS